MQNRLLPLLCALLCLSLFVSSGMTQVSPNFNQRDDQYRLLGLKRAKEAYEVAKAEYNRQQELFDRQLITSADLERAKGYLSDAEVNYQQSLLAVLFEQQYVTVASAVKYYAADNTRHVKVTLANASGGTAEFDKLINIDDKLFRSLQPDIVNNVYVSLLNEDGATISQPYESKIDQLKHGNPVTLDFKLLQDLDAVAVSIIYGSGTQRTMKVFLQKDESKNKVAVQSEQFSQEVDLGKTATYDLGLELFSGSNNTFSLEVVNLPAQISRTFKDAATGARLSQVKFSESSRSKQASLAITLPDRPNEGIVIDSPIHFFAVALPPDKAKDFSTKKQWTHDELEKLDVGFVRLELLPRGKGMILIRSNQLFQTIDEGGTATITMNFLNEGSARIDNMEFAFDLPLNWRKQIDPPNISRLEIGQDTIITLSFTPPEDATAGRYDIRVRTTAQSNGQPVNGEDKTITVEIKAGSSVIGTIVIVLLIVGLVGGIVMFGVKLSRK